MTPTWCRPPRVGTRRVYRLDPEGLDLLRTYLDRLWAGALDRFAEAAEAAHVGRPGLDGPTDRSSDHRRRPLGDHP